MRTVVLKRVCRERDLVVFAVGLGLLVAGWVTVHETGFVILATFEAQFANCLSGVVGLTAGGALAAVSCARPAGLLRSIGFIPLAVAQIAVAVGYDLAFGLSPYLTYGACCVYNILFALLLGRVLESLGTYPPKRVMAVLAASLLCAGAVTSVWGAVGGLPPFDIGSLAGQIAVASLAAACLSHRVARAAEKGACRSDGDAWAERGAMRGLPVRMVVHMGCYFVVFGLTHSISSEIVSATQTKLLSGHVGLMAAAILFWVALTVTGTDRIWHKVRGAVFPLAMLGFILLPSALRNSHALSVLLAECASYLYYLIALFAAVKAARLGIAPIGRTFATVCMLGGAFYAVGISCGTAARLMGPFDEATYSVLTACVFVLLTVGTFWVGDDKTADMFWGLEKKLSPKAYNEQQTRLRCAAVASRYGLTRRESEILAPLALGTSPDAIGREQTVSIATVRSHIHNIYVKLGVHTHAELIELVERTPLDQGER